MNKEKELEKHTDYIRGLANNSITKDRINKALNRIMVICNNGGKSSMKSQIRHRIKEIDKDSELSNLIFKSEVIDVIDQQGLVLWETRI